MNYFDFSSREKVNPIPKSKLRQIKKGKSCFIDSNKISRIENARGLDRFLEARSKIK